MVNAPGLSLKIVVVAHFVLTTWALLCNGFLPGAYMYSNLITLLIGVLAIVYNENADAVLLFLVLHLISILNDIIILAIYQPLGNLAYEIPVVSYMRNTYRFSLGMCIVNLVLKPLTGFVLFRVFQDRGGESSANWIPGLPNFNRMPGNYENIDQPVPTNTVETASPHHSIDTAHADPYMSGKGES